MSDTKLYTMDDVEWREDELRDAVCFLDAVNPKGYSAEGIKACAVRAWVESGCKPTFIGTAGWYVSFVKKSYEAEKPWIALVSVMSYTAVKALPSNPAT
jgi:hypothetical protein